MPHTITLWNCDEILLGSKCPHSGDCLRSEQCLPISVVVNEHGTFSIVGVLVDNAGELQRARDAALRCSSTSASGSCAGNSLVVVPLCADGGTRKFNARHFAEILHVFNEHVLTLAAAADVDAGRGGRSDKHVHELILDSVPAHSIPRYFTDVAAGRSTASRFPLQPPSLPLSEYPEDISIVDAELWNDLCTAADADCFGAQLPRTSSSPTPTAADAHVNFVFLPPNETSYQQPLDIGIFKHLNEAYKSAISAAAAAAATAAPRDVGMLVSEICRLFPPVLRAHSPSCFDGSEFVRNLRRRPEDSQQQTAAINEDAIR